MPEIPDVLVVSGLVIRDGVECNVLIDILSDAYIICALVELGFPDGHFFNRTFPLFIFIHDSRAKNYIRIFAFYQVDPKAGSYEPSAVESPFQIVLILCKHFIGNPRASEEIDPEKIKWKKYMEKLKITLKHFLKSG